jgi:hypothetical protein
MRAYTTLRELVRSCGATLIEEDLSPEVAGSAQAVFLGCSNTKFRFVWDARENCGFLQPEGTGEKEPVQAAVVHKPTGANFSNLHEFLVTAERLATGAH